jgi:hypothetical protein
VHFALMAPVLHRLPPATSDSWKIDMGTQFSCALLACSVVFAAEH